MKLLTPEAVEHYREHGWYAPVSVLSSSEANTLRQRLETFEARAGLAHAVFAGVAGQPAEDEAVELGVIAGDFKT